MIIAWTTATKTKGHMLPVTCKFDMPGLTSIMQVCLLSNNTATKQPINFNVICCSKMQYRTEFFAFEEKKKTF